MPNTTFLSYIFQSCSSVWPRVILQHILFLWLPLPSLSPLGSFQKCLISLALMDFQLWCKHFQDWHVSLHRPSPSFTSLYLSELLHVMCLNQQFSHIYPWLSVSRPSVYSRFFVLFLSRRHQMANSGQTARRPSNTAFMNEWKELGAAVAQEVEWAIH